MYRFTESLQVILIRGSAKGVKYKETRVVPSLLNFIRPPTCIGLVRTNFPDWSL